MRMAGQKNLAILKRLPYVNTMSIDKSKVKRNFTLAAASYDLLSHVQEEVCGRFFNFMAEKRTRFPATLSGLDIGTGTGRILFKFSSSFPATRLHGCDLAFDMVKQASRKALGQTTYLTSPQPLFLQADAEHLPYKAASFDLVISNLSFQWVPDLGQAFREVYRLLVPGGEFFFSTLIEGTFPELRASLQHVCQKVSNRSGDLPLNIPADLHAQTLTERLEIEECLQSSGFHHLFLEDFCLQPCYPDVRTFLRELKAIGAAKAQKNGKRPNLSGRKILTEMIDYYQHTFQNGQGIPATYAVLLVYAQKTSD